MIASQPMPVKAAELLETYDAFLFDAFGVLVDNRGALPHVSEFLARLEASGKPFWVVTNDAYRLPENAAAFYASAGLRIDVGRVLTAGDCLAALVDERGLRGAEFAVLGSADTEEYVRRAGGRVTATSTEFGPVDALVIGSNVALASSQTFDELLNSVHKLIVDGRPPLLILPNTDVVYPKGEQIFGTTAGAVAVLLEQALNVLHGEAAPTFIRLGKPFPPLFEAALKRLGPRMRAVMIGDQPATDIRGANAMGIDSALVLTGVTTPAQVARGFPDDATPKWILPSLAL